MIRFAFVLALLPSLAFAQHDSTRRADVIRFADGVIRTYTSPLRWKKNNWLEFATVAGGTVALSLIDQPVNSFWKRQDNLTLDHVNTVGYHYGKPYAGFIFSGGFYAAGMLLKNEWARETGLALSSALLTVGLLEMGLKPLIGRARPGFERGNYHFQPMNDRIVLHSFPSGHSSIAFTISFVMAKQSEALGAKLFFYSLGGATAICRLYSNAHWISDVAFGGVLAWYVSESVIEKLNENRFRKHRKTNYKVAPYPGGITIKATFN